MKLRRMNRLLFVASLVLLVCLLSGFVTGCDPMTEETKIDPEKEKSDFSGTIIFGDAGWESIQVNNYIAKHIIEKGYGYNTDILTSSEDAVREALRSGSIDIFMEYWIYDMGEYRDLIASRDYAEMGVNFTGIEGLWVPSYVVNGDHERGIEPVAPDLETVEGLASFAGVFGGVIHNGISGWPAVEINQAKFKGYGLDSTFSLLTPDSDEALDNSIITAYENGAPWVGYYWAPSTIMGKYDMIRLKEAPFDESAWNESRLCEYPESMVTVVVNGEFAKKVPDVVNFLKNYQTGADLINELLFHMDENGLTAEECALWFLKEKEDIWSKWIPADVAERVKSAF